MRRFVGCGSKFTRAIAWLGQLGLIWEAQAVATARCGLSRVHVCSPQHRRPDVVIRSSLICTLSLGAEASGSSTPRRFGVSHRRAGARGRPGSGGWAARELGRQPARQAPATGAKQCGQVFVLTERLSAFAEHVIASSSDS